MTGSQVYNSQKKMAKRKLDPQSVLADHESGMSGAAIAAKYGCHVSAVSHHLRKLGINRSGTRRPAGPARQETPQRPAPAPSSHALVAAPAGARIAPPAEGLKTAQSANGHGRARCRVAMLEVEGDATAVQHAVDAIKAALENRRE